MDTDDARLEPDKAEGPSSQSPQAIIPENDGVTLSASVSTTDIEPPNGGASLGGATPPSQPPRSFGESFAARLGNVIDCPIAVYAMAINQQLTENRHERARVFQVGGRSRLIVIAAESRTRLEAIRSSSTLSQDEIIELAAEAFSRLALIVSDCVFREMSVDTSSALIILLIEKMKLNVSRELHAMMGSPKRETSRQPQKDEKQPQKEEKRAFQVALENRSWRAISALLKPIFQHAVADDALDDSATQDGWKPEESNKWK